ncbi:MAG: hypothetical protein ABR571_12035 [Jatrophihabitans sp.]|uniref:hypothetical protein n=1 Tax=Jatrophihabitans sp. TaxID=1932789 RepID=UPI0039103F24
MTPLFTRRERPPADVVARLDKDERVVSWADTADDDLVVATPLGLWWPDGGELRRMQWQHIDRVIWRDDVLTVIEADVVDDLLLVDRAPVAARLTRPRDLPPTVRKRVEGNIVQTEVAAVSGGSVRFVGRRVPGQDGIGWWAHLDGTTPDTEELRSAIRARIEILSAS